MEAHRDLLIEHMHAVQDRHICLREGHLLALAELLRVALIEVFEVATFYAHFDVLPDEASAPAPVTVRVCESLPCAMAGAGRLLEALRAAPIGGARLVAAPAWAPATLRRPVPSAMAWSKARRLRVSRRPLQGQPRSRRRRQPSPAIAQAAAIAPSSPCTRASIRLFSVMYFRR